MSVCLQTVDAKLLRICQGRDLEREGFTLYNVQYSGPSFMFDSFFE